MNEFLEPFERMIEAIATPALVRAVEHGMGAGSLWDVVSASGFLDALVPEDRGGAGLSLAQVHPLWLALGRHAVPLPIGETMIARYLLAMAGADLPEGPIVLAEAAAHAESVISGGLLAAHALVEADGALHLIEAASMTLSPTGVNASLAARSRWSPSTGLVVGAAPAGGLRALGAILRATLIAGAAARLTGMATAYANERIQFGKPIGRQQALQQNLAVMAEDMVAARIASQLGCAGGLPPSPAGRVSEKQVARTIRDTLAETGYLLDPHTAVGVFTAKKFEKSSAPMVTLATAHPAKFPLAVKTACGIDPALPSWLDGLMQREERFEVLDADIKTVEDFIAQRARIGN